MSIPYKEGTLSSALISGAFVFAKSHHHVQSNIGFFGAFTILVIVQFFGWVVYCALVYPKFISPLRNLPAPKGGNWLMGHTSLLLGNPNGYPAGEWMRSIPNKGLIRYLGILNAERVVVTSQEGLAEIMTRTDVFQKPPFISHVAGQILGPGLVLVDGDEHKRQRKMLMPAFTAKNVKPLYSLFWIKSKEVVNRITDAVSDKSIGDIEHTDSKDTIAFEVSDWTSRAALDVITLAALGQDWESIKNPEGTLSKTYHGVFQLSRLATAMAVIKMVIPPSIVHYLQFLGNSAFEKAATTIKDTCRTVVRAKKEKLAKDQLFDVDLLSVLLKGGEIQEEEAVHQMMTFLAAGHETLAAGLTWAIYMLCVHPDWQAKLRDEVRERLPSAFDDSEVTNQQMDDMIQVNAFCNEVLRYFPPIPSTLRTPIKDSTLLGQPIPKGVRIVLAIVGTNKDPTFWGDDSLEFKPERWITDGGSKIDTLGGASSKYGSLTFMHGIRNCIGQSFAKGEMACLLAALVGRFEFELKNKEELIEKNVKISRGGVTSRPLNGMWVKAKVLPGW